MIERRHCLTATRNPSQQTVDIYAYYRRGDDVIAHETSVTAGPTVFTRTVEPGTTFSPFARLDEDAAQKLMDSLWSAGLRPTEGRTSAGLAAAQEDHLKSLKGILEAVLPSALRGTLV